MKKLELNFIEKGKLSNEKLSQISGGWSCGTYKNCHDAGKNSCIEWADCTSSDPARKTVCIGSAYTFVIASAVTAKIEVSK